ncbi:MAG: phosphate ABC transporter permease PstA [Candidatus Goldbacteria bacterium]|nr:phosphate ABC transporter permease PstA [Candidatus Goldiibacteriota bacterium]
MIETQATDRKRYQSQSFGFILLYLCILAVVLSLVVLVGFIVVKGIGVINPDFFLKFPENGMSEGGIFPAIVGTFMLSVGAIVFSLPLGVLTAIWLTEYNTSPRLVRMLRIGINSLAGVPSIVFGLFGLAFLVKFMQFGVSLLSGVIVLGIMVLPTIIATSEEALLSVPKAFKEASLALGATRWQTMYKVVLPNAVSGIITGVILGIGRAAGETAPIMFTAATFFTIKLPDSLFSEVMALPYHIYALMTEGSQAGQMEIAYGTALVLLMLVLAINAVAIFIRIKARRKRKW